MARRIDQHIFALAVAEPNLRGVDRHTLVALGFQAVHQERPFERHAAAPAHFFDGLELALGQHAGLVKQTTHEGRLAMVDMADDDDAQLLLRGRAIDFQHRRFGHLVHYMYPDVRSRSNESSASWSIRRPARSGVRVVSSSAMISSIVDASLVTGAVMFFSPSER